MSTTHKGPGLVLAQLGLIKKGCVYSSGYAYIVAQYCNKCLVVSAANHRHTQVF